MAIRPATKRFVDITNQRLSVSSRLNLYNILRTTENNTYFINIFRNFTISDIVKNNNIYFNIYYAEDEDWWDNISYKYYGTEVLWYLVCEMNNVVNPFEEIEQGQQIKVLKEGYLYNVFKNLKNIFQL